MRVSYEPYSIFRRNVTYYILTINAPLQPRDRWAVLEYPINFCLKRSHLGAVTGGGTALLERGGIKNCDIEIRLKNKPNALPDLLSLLKIIRFPKGSILYHNQEVIAEVGHLEGMEVRINGTDLPNEVYAAYDINNVISELESLLGEAGRRFSSLEAAHTYLYFYGESYEQMKSLIMPYVNEHPLFEKCEIKQLV